jgi:hypothetical protein
MRANGVKLGRPGNAEDQHDARVGTTVVQRVLSMAAIVSRMANDDCSGTRLKGAMVCGTLA